jgi:hypothetical protein
MGGVRVTTEGGPTDAANGPPAPQPPSRRRTSARRAGDGLETAQANTVCGAGAMGGGSAASFRGRRIFMMTLLSVMAAMRRSRPCRHTGQRAMSMAHTRLRHCAQRQCGEAVAPAGASTPCWRGVGMLAARSVLCGAQPPP